MEKSMKKLLAAAVIICLPAVANAGFIILDDTAPPASRAKAPVAQSNLALEDDDMREEDLSRFERRRLAKKRAADADAANESRRRVVVTGKSMLNMSGLKKISGQSARSSAIIHKGKKPRRVGAGVNLNGTALLGDALVEIIPASYTVYASEGVDLDANMALMSGKNWVDALDATLLRSRYSAAIDWVTSEVIIAVDEDADRVVAGMGKRSRGAQAAEKVTQKWRVRLDDGLLSGVVERWCKESKGVCTKVTWNSTRDLPIEAEADLVGSFNEVLETIMSAVAESSGHDFSYVIHKNGVLSVFDGNGAQK